MSKFGDVILVVHDSIVISNIFGVYRIFTKYLNVDVAFEIPVVQNLFK